MVTNPKLIFIGYTNIDINITPKGQTTLPGGAAYFAAIAASRILQPIGLVTRIGTDFDPKFLLTRVLAEGVHIISDKPTARSTQIYHSITDLTNRDITLDWGVAPDLNPLDIPNHWLKTAEIIHIATMPPLQQKKFLDYVKIHAPQVKISIDTDIFLLKNPSSKKKVEYNFKQANIVFANRKEYESLKITIDQVPEAIIKLDQEGAYLLQYGKIVMSVPAQNVEPIDPTGAGDIFAGTFLACRLQGKTDRQCLEQAVESATYSITKPGVMHLFQ